MPPTYPDYPAHTGLPGYPNTPHSAMDDSTLVIIFASVFFVLFFVAMIVGVTRHLNETGRRQRAARAEGLRYGEYEERFPVYEEGYRHRKLELLETIAARLEGIESAIDELGKGKGMIGKRQEEA